MADKDQLVGSLGITQRWKEFVAGFHARLFSAMLYTPNGDSMADDTADAVKAKLSANSGVDIGDVDVTSVIPGTGATNLGKAVDSVAGATDTGIVPLAIRDDALAALTPIEGDYVPLRTDANGALWTRDDALDAVVAGSELQVDVVAALPAGDNNIGNVDIVSLPAGNLGQQAMAASVSVVPASNVTDGTYLGDIKFGEALPESLVDDAAFTPATSRVIPMGMLADETTPDSVDEGDIGIPRMTLSRIPWAATRKKVSASADTEEELNKPVTLLASAARTALATAAITNVNHKALVIVVDVTARAVATTLTPKLTLKGPVTGTYDLDIWTAAAAINTADATYAYVFALGGSGSAGSYTEAVNMPVPDCQLTVTPNDANSVTYSVGAYWMV